MDGTLGMTPEAGFWLPQAHIQLLGHSYENTGDNRPIIRSEVRCFRSMSDTFIQRNATGKIPPVSCGQSKRMSIVLLISNGNL